MSLLRLARPRQGLVHSALLHVLWLVRHASDTRRFTEHLMDHDTRVQALKTAWEAGDADTVLEHLEVLITSDPTQRRWPFDKGLVLEGLGDIEGAMAAYEEAIRRDPDYTDALVNLGRWHDETNQFQRALELYDRALSIDPEDAVGWSNRGNTLLKLDRFEDALQSFEKAIAIEPVGPQLRGRQSALASMSRVDECNAVRPVGPADRGVLHQHTRRIGDRTVVVRFFGGQHTRPDWLDQHARSMLDYCEGVADVPPGIADGVRIQWGWTPLLVRAHGDELVLCEPDPASPFELTVWDVGFTLQTSIMHAMTLDMLEVEPADCQMQDVVAVDLDAIGERQVAMRRLHPTDETGFSGWLIGSADPEAFQAAMVEQRFVPVRSGELIRLRHPLIKALVLPPDYTALFEDHAIVAVFDAEGQDVWNAGDPA